METTCRGPVPPSHAEEDAVELTVSDLIAGLMDGHLLRGDLE